MADKSLDDIIRERKIGGTRGESRGRARGSYNVRPGQRGGHQGGQLGKGDGWDQQGGGGAINYQANMPNRSQVIQSLTRQNTFRPNQSIAVTVPDARDKLISKARLTDARVKLNKKAQLVDVRVKLNAKRKMGASQQSFDHGVIQGPVTGEQLRNLGHKQLAVVVNNPLASLKHQQQTIPTQQQNKTTAEVKPGSTVLLGSEGLQITTINKAAKKRQAKQIQHPAPTDTSLEDDLLYLPLSTKFKKIAAQAPSVPPQVAIKTTVSESADILGFSARSLSSLFQLGTAQQAGALQRVAMPSSAVPLVAQGTRLIVSNLCSSVSEADIKELYGDVGPLKRARLVRSGLAEIVYIKREHALEAIVRYHNRELDGLPMQCKLDTSTVPEATGASIQVPTTGKRLPMSERFKLISGGTTDFSLSSIGMRSDAMAPCDKEIEAATVHKALFKTGVTQSAVSRPVVFTVKI